MASASSPTVWRRWLAFELVRLRQRARLEQRDVARELRCSVAKISYYETAERPVVVRDLDEVLLPLYRVPRERWPTYLQAARDSRQKGWWERYDAVTLPGWFSLFVGLEQGASVIRVYEAQLVPGLLQTREYAEAVSRSGTAERTDEEVARHVELRMTRQAVLDRDPDPLRLWVMLDEAVLRRVVGSPALMAEQLRHLAAMAQRPKVTIQVMPYSGGAYPGMTGRFQILDFPWPSDPGLAYVEHRAGSLYLEEPNEISAHSVAFEHMSANALSPSESLTLIADAAEEFA
ncbi:helix-turn-helix domain-containing protein [Pseudonocardia humida]|uniref:Helix-turn-helix domain-containing protein n=1 Tax=Pseudonocardia humida TaxID=2800819 RepID=A0ABT0ZYG8_9PSEU|nr:helix-turn-helix transcriptional regulator [Pseudonocardia humida]MCO1655780.1 helix-turn-helix domain-containing protein [Pseudonocardia humida]